MRYLIDTSRVAHERLQDEVIIINMASGAYYSGSGTAADLWTLVSRGASAAEAAEILASAYCSDQAEVLKDIDRCITSLVERGIVQACDPASPPNTDMTLPESARARWSAPEFDEYTDMWDLIRLDPIHDVGDAGWPYAAPTAKL
jgi:hypothetical protein